MVVVFLIEFELLFTELVFIVYIFDFEGIFLRHETNHVDRVLLSSHIQWKEDHLRKEGEDYDTETIVSDDVEYKAHCLSEDIA